MLVPLGQLPSPADSGVVTTSASSSAVAGLAVTPASVVSTPSVMAVEQSHKHRRVMDSKEQELMMLHFKD